MGKGRIGRISASYMLMLLHTCQNFKKKRTSICLYLPPPDFVRAGSLAVKTLESGDAGGWVGVRDRLAAGWGCLHYTDAGGVINQGRWFCSHLASTPSINFLFLALTRLS